MWAPINKITEVKHMFKQTSIANGAGKVENDSLVNFRENVIKQYERLTIVSLTNEKPKTHVQANNNCKHS